MQARKTSRNNRQYHGLGGTPTYSSWYSMIERCTNPKNASWPRYGARGVTVCDRWMSLAAFVEDMGLRPAGMTIDRIDIAKGYEPGNCRWATELEQQRNRGNVTCSEAIAARVREAGGTGLTQRAIADMFGIDQGKVSRILAGKAWA